MMYKLFASACIGLAALGSTPIASADTWPSRPIVLLVPWAPGGSSDTIARILGEDLSRRLNTTVVVENKPGAGGTIGSAQLARAKPDGYTFMLGVSGDQVNAEFLYPNLSYSPSKDIVPVSTVAREAILIAGNAKLPAAGPQDMLALAGKQELSFGTSGIGSTGHLAGELLKRRAHAQLNAIPYKGNAPAITDAIAGHVDMVIASPVAVVEHVRTGSLKALAVTSAERIEQLPDVPTLKESGYDIEVNTWYMVVAPAKTPQDIVERMSAAVRESVASPAVHARITQIGAIPQASTPQEMGALLKDERTVWGKLIQEAGISAQ
ncbi:tripartite tricarboxylate transporter substrate binding protein [Verticiella sediminum]|uniref:Tripartite tricarboxylate transporter substrate binding protein n=1 Tax=Verticiella sediminum TaxID=1247510 RepID=A0A556AJ93_9BURK|nr:tripartite tricarboxylate transporter substrate binding protein [Verticiella sediminum]TSH92939.1 tripartite tricarboxylate transporter substrate binding protein [Verticiella sediminum]